MCQYQSGHTCYTTQCFFEKTISRVDDAIKTHLTFLFGTKIFFYVHSSHAAFNQFDGNICWENVHIVFMQMIEYSRENLSPIGWKTS
jgi:hypothetical protein